MSWPTTAAISWEAGTEASQPEDQSCGSPALSEGPYHMKHRAGGAYWDGPGLGQPMVGRQGWFATALPGLGSQFRPCGILPGQPRHLLWSSSR
ncbi:hypothetical protein Pmani_010095 [Petrolisthes manimaculis]|uniref:Uncharacterized protein n=1 Tax=Petrolisthes manimaculis TaxID=1843537 RepID=A0AAE1UH66_9EUCA|nr:hypothetical protein Pmani_010049 [Petrolisthes manimaculis]KAK4319010.1 hypothetical protein Pmani_010095 [Petrolisthes manimaculis]